MKRETLIAVCSSSLLAVGCGATAHDNSGGFQLEPGQGTCPVGYVVSNSDYSSTNISALSPTGNVLSTSLISSGSAAPGLSTALSGDVVFPSSPLPSHDIVLIDRYPNSVLTWVEPATGQVQQQLAVGTGFAANPHDYLELGPNKAYVSRYESNQKSGVVPFDEGGDLLVLDPTLNSIVGRIDLSSAAGDFLPRADHLLRVGSDVWVSLHRFDADFKTAGDARVLGVDSVSDAPTWTLDLPGLANCGAIARSPSGRLVALACSGVASDADPTSRSGIVLLDATKRPPVVTQQFSVAAELGAPIGSTLAFASERSVVSVALGDFGAKRSDQAFTLDLDLGTVQPLLDAGAPFSLGDVQCAPGCSELCFLADAQAKELHVWRISADGLSPLPSIPGDTSIGLPPRAIGAL